ncbi:MAG: hypothetical protein N3B21_11370 [Clostridia bacterium]|nr:hypothetical protein [Clostridia bacterium]
MADYMPYMQMMGLPGQYYPMMEMPQDQLESMYPRIYYIVYPHVKYQCDMFDGKYGTMYNPSREQLEAMVDDIYRKVEVDVNVEISIPREDGDRQFGFGGRRLFRDLISILLLRQLLSRRRPYGGYFDVYGGYPGGYGGYPGGYGGGFGGY